MMQFLGLEKVSGTLVLKFGRDLPEVSLLFDSGKLLAAEFGELLGDAVLDMLLCQEFLIKEISFAPGRVKVENQYSAVVRGYNISEAILHVSTEVDQCQARPLIYGLLPIQDKRSNESRSLLDALHDFTNWEQELKRIPASKKDRTAPLRQCMLLCRALRNNVVTYKTPLISLKKLQTVIHLINPLSETERKNLYGYMKSLLPHSRATHIPLDRFYALAAAIESMAGRRSEAIKEEVRGLIKELLEEAKAKEEEQSSKESKPLK